MFQINSMTYLEGTLYRSIRFCIFKERGRWDRAVLCDSYQAQLSVLFKLLTRRTYRSSKVMTVKSSLQQVLTIKNLGNEYRRKDKKPQRICIFRSQTFDHLPNLIKTIN